MLAEFHETLFVDLRAPAMLRGLRMSTALKAREPNWLVSTGIQEIARCAKPHFLRLYRLGDLSSASVSADGIERRSFRICACTARSTVRSA